MYKIVAFLKRSLQLGRIESSTTVPTRKSQFMIPEIGYENTILIVAQCDGIWRPMYVLYENILI